MCDGQGEARMRVKWRWGKGGDRDIYNSINNKNKVKKASCE